MVMGLLVIASSPFSRKEIEFDTYDVELTEKTFFLGYPFY